MLACLDSELCSSFAAVPSPSSFPSRPLLFVAYEMHKLLVSLAAAAASLVAASPAAWSEQTPLVVDDDVKVPVELGVMSKCPDALACESIFDQVIPKVGTKMDLELLYIGQCVCLLRGVERAG